MNRIKQQHIIHMHETLIEHFGGLNGVRDEKLLDSALNAPFQTFDGEELYPGLVMKAACLCYGLIHNHAFQDGNKRIGVLSMVVFLDINGVEIDVTNEEMIALGIQVASGDMSLEQVAGWISTNIL